MDGNMRSDDHFDTEAWIDFVRGLRSPAQNSAMQTHLASGCAPCSEIASLFAQVWKVGRSAGEDRVPEDWSRKAEDILRNETMAPIRLLPTRWAIPAISTVGVLEASFLRAEYQSNRHVVYETQGCAVTLKLDEDRNSREVLIIGQITDQRRPERRVGYTPIFLFRGTKGVAITSSDEFGEFQLACELKRKMLISFPFDGFRINVTLDDLTPGEETMNS